jgi:hypothetical protein
MTLSIVVVLLPGLSRLLLARRCKYLSESFTHKSELYRLVSGGARVNKTLVELQSKAEVHDKRQNKALE